jgi:hypothetical protein
MSPDDLLWSAPQRGGLTEAEWNVVVDHLTRQLGLFVGREIFRDSNIFCGEGKSFCFSVDFWTPTAIASPLDFQLRGTFGAADYDGQDSKYIGVQGWLYPYIAGQRVMTTADGHNHIFLRYAKVDAIDNDWEMRDCTGVSAWRSLGWSPDEYEEFDGYDTWVDPANSLPG